MSAPDVLAVTHTAVVCVKDPRTIDFHTKSYSFEFACPRCGNRRRMNTNYLGNRRHLVCDGGAIKPTGTLSWEQWDAMRRGVQ